METKPNEYKDENKNPNFLSGNQGLFFVAGAGFEPATFGL
tara:strand:- start:5 stop:124 length:120 start_codon:yes stop_codon:yes gene_type:complete